MWRMAQFIYRAIFPKKKSSETNLKMNCQFYCKKKQTNKSTIFMVYDNILLSTLELRQNI